MEDNKKIAHLEMLQNIINRFSSNSFTLKGLCFSLMVGILSFYKGSFIWLIILIIDITFWLLDSFYLARERYYIKIYNKVRLLKEDDIDFFMGGDEINNKYPLKKETLFKSFLSISMLPYIVIFIASFIVFIIKLYMIYLFCSKYINCKF